MDILVLDKQFKVTSLIDLYESLIWTVKYCDYGDFELYTSATKDLLALPFNTYLQIRGSDQTMIVEEKVLSTHPSDGNYITVKGRTLDSILTRRVLHNHIILKGNLQDELEKLINENVIIPSNVDRKIPNFVFKRSTDPAVTAPVVNRQVTGDNLHAVVKDLCDENDLGFSLKMDGDKFTFELYSGADRSYDQLINPYVVFSPNFENLMSSQYTDSLLNYSNMVYVAGEDQGYDRALETIGNDKKGLDRWEMYVDARDLQSEKDGSPIPPADYKANLISRGTTKLKDRKHIQDFEGEVEDTHTFIFGEDYYLGDKVQVVNEYGLDTVSRVGEVTTVMNDTGYNVLPTFTIIKERTDKT